jgi:glutamate racemase
MRQLPIGVFDSGKVGLIVLNDIVKYEHLEDGKKGRLFRNESFIYLADMANMFPRRDLIWSKVDFCRVVRP